MTTLKLPFLFIISLLSTSLIAGDINSTVNYVRVDQSGRGIVKFDDPKYGTLPSCGNSHPNHLAFDTNSPGGQAILSVALSAQMSGKRIWARGTEACSSYGTVENWNYGWVNTD